MTGIDEMLKLAVQQGLWAVMFIVLFVWNLKENKTREEQCKVRETQLMEFITDMTKQFEGLVKQFENLHEDVQEIKTELKHKK